MNREIKFRAFDDGKMLKMPLDTNYGLSRFFGMLRDDAVIMQFLGLYDKEQNKIYEEDVLSDGQDNYRVWIEEGKMLIGGLDKGWDEHISTHKVKRMSVIGNIYENPELLK